MGNNIQQQILDELKKISKNLSLENVTMEDYNVTGKTFGEALFDHIITINKNIETFNRRLKKIEETKKD